MPGAVNRRRVNLFVAAFLAVLVIDAFRPMNDGHQWLKDRLEVPLDVTGLWQGPWRLYGPEVDKDNLRVRAEVVFADQAVATWRSPDWSQRSAPRKLVDARHINYFSNVLHAGKQPAWNSLCAYLARTMRHPDGKPVAVEQVRLSLRGALIPPPGEAVVPAAPYLAFDDWQVIWTWRPPG
jgi:hypothetical protein